MPIKKCAGFKTRDGKENPNCQKQFWAENHHYKRRQLCSSCQKLKNNAYHCEYLRKWRAKKNKS